MTKRRKRICRPEPHDMMQDNWPRDENDIICTVCQDGGDLILCDLCPSAFHKSCIGLKDVPDGDWFCPACCCGICGCSIEPTIHYHTCGQCERKYHTGCLRKRNVDNLESDPKGNWFCSDNCKKIFLGLHEYLGKQIPVGVDDLTWSLLKSVKPDSDNINGPDNDAVTESYIRLSLALQVMQECFKHFKQPRTGRDLAEDIIFSRGSDLNDMNFQGFYTVVLEKNDEIITVATVRIYGAKVAEVPLIGTRLQYRRCGMCCALMNLLEKMLMDLGVERLILPVVPSSLRKWKSSFGYSNMKDSDRLQLLDYRFMEFQDTIMCQKPLLTIPLAEPRPSIGIPLDVSGSGDDIDFNRSSGDNVSFTWKIDNFSSFCKRYSETFLIGDLGWRMLMYPKGNSVDDLSVYLNVQGASELPLGWSRCVQFSFTVVNQLQRSKSITRETKHVFNKKVSNYGFKSLIPLDELHDLSKGYLVNDTCIIEANVAVSMVERKISQDPKTGSSIPRPVEYSNQGPKEQGPPLDMGSMNVPGPSSAARKGTGLEHATAFQDASSSEQACFEISDSSTDPSLNMESSEVPDLSSSARKATGFEHVTASQDTASSEQVCIEISDTSTDPPLVESEEAVQKSIGKCEKEIELKRRKLRLIQKSTVECSNTLEATERKIREYNKAFSLLKQSMEEWCCKLELKQREFEGCVSKLELKEKEVESKVEELHLIGKRVSDCLDDARLKEKHVDSLEKSIQQGKQQLDAQQKSVQVREKSLDSLQKCAEERSKLLDLLCQGHQRQGRELEQQANELKFKERQVELKFDELNLKDKRVNERLNEVQLKEKRMDSLEKSIQADEQYLDSLQKSAAQCKKQLDSLQKSVQESENNLVSLQKSVQEREKNLDSLSQELQRKEREVEQQAKELELQLKQINSQVKMEQLEPTPAVENASVPSSASDDSTTNMDGITLQLVMNEQVERIDLAGSRMSAVLQSSSNPAKLVLDAMQGFYPSNLTENNREFESHLRVVRKSCILLLQELKKMSPLINPQVREEAMKLAADWKAEMTVAADNSWEILGFLWLITTYELTGICDSGELQILLAMVALPEQTSELSRALGIADKAPGTNITSSIVKTERPESSLARNAATLSSLNYSLQNEMMVSLPSIVKTERPESSLARNAATLSSSKNALQNKRLVTLQSSSDPAKLVLDMMQRSFTRYWTKGDISSKEGVVSAIIFLLKFVMGHSAPVGPHLKEDATNLAAEWKAKWGADTENSLESLGFLLFIAIYGLLGTLHEDEIVMLLGRISQHTRSLELCEIPGFVQYIPDFIQKLIKKKRVIEAVRSICTFKLIDKLLPVPLLQEYVEDAKKCSEVICSSPMTLDEKDKAVNGKIADLRAVIQCIKDYNLESDYPSKTVEMQIVQLDLLKEKCRSLAPSLVPKGEQQEERKRKKPNTSSSAPKLQPGKLPKTKFVFGGSRP